MGYAVTTEPAAEVRSMGFQPIHIEAAPGHVRAARHAAHGRTKTARRAHHKSLSPRPLSVRLVFLPPTPAESCRCPRSSKTA